MKHLGDIIKELREEAGYGVRQLARLADVDPSSLSKLENHQQDRLNRENLARVAQALGTNAAAVKALVGQDDDRRPPTRWPTLEEFLDRDGNLTEQQRDALLAVYSAFVPSSLRSTTDPPPCA